MLHGFKGRILEDGLNRNGSTAPLPNASFLRRMRWVRVPGDWYLVSGRILPSLAWLMKFCSSWTSHMVVRSSRKKITTYKWLRLRNSERPNTGLPMGWQDCIVIFVSNCVLQKLVPRVCEVLTVEMSNSSEWSSFVRLDRFLFFRGTTGQEVGAQSWVQHPAYNCQTFRFHHPWRLLKLHCHYCCVCSDAGKFFLQRLYSSVSFSFGHATSRGNQRPRPRVLCFRSQDIQYSPWGTCPSKGLKLCVSMWDIWLCKTTTLVSWLFVIFSNT